MKSATLLLIIVFALPSCAYCQYESQHCDSVPTKTPTRWGGNERIVVDLLNEPLRDLHGTVEWPLGEPADGTLLQIFKRRPSDPLIPKQDQKEREPVVACTTKEDGVFSFSLPPGQYELRASMNAGINVTSVVVTIKRGSHLSKEIVVGMHPGT